VLNPPVRSGDLVGVVPLDLDPLCNDIYDELLLLLLLLLEMRLPFYEGKAA